MQQHLHLRPPGGQRRELSQTDVIRADHDGTLPVRPFRHLAQLRAGAAVHLVRSRGRGEAKQRQLEVLANTGHDPPRTGHCAVTRIVADSARYEAGGKQWFAHFLGRARGLVRLA